MWWNNQHTQTEVGGFILADGFRKPVGDVWTHGITSFVVDNAVEQGAED